MLPTPTSNGRIGGASSGIAPRKLSAGQQGLPAAMGASGISPRLGGGPTARPVSTMGIPQTHLGGGFGHQLPPAIISPRLPTLPPPPPEDIQPELPVLPSMAPPISGSHTPLAPRFEPVAQVPLAIPPPPAQCVSPPPFQLLSFFFAFVLFLGSRGVLPMMVHFSEPPKKDDEWQQFFTDDGHPYFYNAATGESRWA